MKLLLAKQQWNAIPVKISTESAWTFYKPFSITNRTDISLACIQHTQLNHVSLSAAASTVRSPPQREPKWVCDCLTTGSHKQGSDAKHLKTDYVIDTCAAQNLYCYHNH